jgi:hypothetical protein
MLGTELTAELCRIYFLKESLDGVCGHGNEIPVREKNLGMFVIGGRL